MTERHEVVILCMWWLLVKGKQAFFFFFNLLSFFLIHFSFKYSKVFPLELELVTPCGPRIFGYYAFSTKKARLVFLFKKKPFLENGLESPLIFVFILKGKAK